MSDMAVSVFFLAGLMRTPEIGEVYYEKRHVVSIKHSEVSVRSD